MHIYISPALTSHATRIAASTGHCFGWAEERVDGLELALSEGQTVADKARVVAGWLHAVVNGASATEEVTVEPRLLDLVVGALPSNVRGGERTWAGAEKFVRGYGKVLSRAARQQSEPAARARTERSSSSSARERSATAQSGGSSIYAQS